MPLEVVPLAYDLGHVPPDVRRFLRVAERRIKRFCRAHHAPRFVPSDFLVVYAALRALEESIVLPGPGLCEWGSGFGVVACLAAWLGYDACGIEINPHLVEAAVALADEFEVSVEFTCGSFLPEDEPSAYEELGRGPDDFDVIFAYPWPDEQRLVARAFERQARAGALLLTYQGQEVIVQRKRKGRGPARNPKDV